MLAVRLLPGLAVIRVQLNPELETRTLMIHFFFLPNSNEKLKISLT